MYSYDYSLHNLSLTYYNVLIACCSSMYPDIVMALYVLHEHTRSLHMQAWMQFICVYTHLLYGLCMVRLYL